MIKGLFYSKSLKRSLTGFLISCFILLGSFVSALSLIPVGMTSQVAGGNNCTILGDLTINCDISNHVMSSNKAYSDYDKMFNYFWSSNGIGIYFKDKNLNIEKQGLIKDGFFICSGDTQSLSNQSSLNYNSCNPGFTRVSGLTYSGLIQKLYSETPTYWWNCSNDGQFGGCLSLIYPGFYFNLQGDFYELNIGNGNFTGQNMGFVGNSFESINFNNSFVIPNPRNFYNGSLNGSTTGGFNNLITGDSMNLNVSRQETIDYLESAGYSKYLCYGGLDNFDLFDPSINYNVIPGTGKSLSQIWGYSSSRAWDTFDDWFRFWNGIYIDENNNYNAMWSSYPAVYHTWFDMYYQYGGQYLVPRTIFEYCQIKLGFSTGTLQNGNCGGYFTPICNSIIEQKQNGTWNGSYYTSGDEQLNNGVGTNWNGVGTMTGITEQKTAVNFIQDFFNKAKSVIPTNYSGNGDGFLPGYIILFMLALILFRFLSH